MSQDNPLTTHATVIVGRHRSRLHIRSNAGVLVMSLHEAASGRSSINSICMAITAAEARELAAAFTKAAAEFEAAN